MEDLASLLNYLNWERLKAQTDPYLYQIFVVLGSNVMILMISHEIAFFQFGNYYDLVNLVKNIKDGDSPTCRTNSITRRPNKHSSAYYGLLYKAA